AEASALGAMVTGGDRTLAEVVLVTERAEPCSPCGRCRQQLAEFGAADTAVHLCGPDGLRRTVMLGQLLPLAFGSTDWHALDVAPQNLPTPAPRPEPGVPKRTT